MIQKLPLRRFAVGDNAYICSETLLTPFLVLRKMIHQKMHSPSYLSQMRLHIEQTIWNYERKMDNYVSTTSDTSENVGKVSICITRLHNFCINEGNTYLNSIGDHQGADSVFMYSDVSETDIAGSSVLSDIIVQELV